MALQSADLTEIQTSRLGWVEQHLHDFFESGGRAGHIMDFSDLGGPAITPCLILRTVGRKSGATRYTPVIYGLLNGEVVVVASKAGADTHPAWYLNITASETVDLQIASQAYRATWREAADDERADIWAFMEHIYPPYKDYRGATDRELPILLMTPKEALPVFTR